MYLYVWVLFLKTMECRPPSGSRAQKKAGNVISVSQDMFWNKGKTKTEASHAFGNYFQLNSHAITAGEMLRKLCFCFTPLQFTPPLLFCVSGLTEWFCMFTERRRARTQLGNLLPYEHFMTRGKNPHSGCAHIVVH